MANDLEGGIAIAAWLIASNLVTELVRMGIVTSDRAVEMTDHALLVVERGLTPEQDKLKTSASARIEGLLETLRALPPSGRGEPRP